LTEETAWPDRALFNEEQIGRLQHELQLSHDENGQILLLAFIVQITKAVWSAKLEEAAKNTRIFPAVKYAKRHVNKISSTARSLRDLLKKEEALSRQILSSEPDWTLNNGLGSPVFQLEGLIEALEMLEKEARRIVDAEEFLKNSVGLVPAEQPNKSPIAARLWPNLFWLWECAGLRVGYSERGPLERFIGLVHEAAEWKPPNGEELKQAVAAWKLMRAEDPHLSRAISRRGQNLP